MIYVVQLASLLLLFVWIALLARVVLSFVFAFARDWRPRGFSALAVEAVFSATDPLLKPLRRLIPPITVGAMRFDVAFIVVFLAIGALRIFLAALEQSLR